MAQIRSIFASKSTTATAVSSSQTNSSIFTSVVHNTGIKIAGVLIISGLCALIGVNVKSANDQANAQLKAASKSTSSQLNIQEVAQPSVTDAANSTSITADGSTSSSSVQTTTDTNGATNVTVMVDGQQVNVPANGSVQKTTTSPDGTTTLTVNNNSDTDGSGYTYGNVNVGAYSSSSSSSFTNTGGTYSYRF